MITYLIVSQKRLMTRIPTERKQFLFKTMTFPTALVITASFIESFGGVANN